jgi:primase-polymerase (primpol)-like protein
MHPKNAGDNMARKSKTTESKVSMPSDELKGWQQIAAFLGEPTSVVQRWASEGMPVRRQGRFVSTTPQELNDWMGKESGKPVHVATGNADLTSQLKRAVSFARREK